MKSFLPLSQSGFQISISNNYVHLFDRMVLEVITIFFRDNFLSLNFIETIVSNWRNFFSYIS